MSNSPPSHYPDIGELGEDLVAKWLESTGWLILERRFCCRWGEIDIIAQYQGITEIEKNSHSGKDTVNSISTHQSQSDEVKTAFGQFFMGETNNTIPEDAAADSPLRIEKSTLAFVEVKTRSSRNWDGGGRSAITAKKQAKLWRTAGMFLAKYPQQADYPCRFDVAIVSCQQMTNKVLQPIFSQEYLASSLVGGYHLQLQEYIPAAFDSVIDHT